MDGAQGKRSPWTPRAHGLGQKRTSTEDAMHVLPVFHERSLLHDPSAQTICDCFVLTVILSQCSAFSASQSCAEAES